MIRFWMLVLGLMAGLSDRAFAQVVPDLTLPVGEQSQVSGTADTQIDGGAIRGSNLFHSFQQFSIPTGGSASFNNTPTITNIITRVTGSDASNIDGVIRANGTANLFLINPNGIVFGANAQLELGGSFLASTADRLVFDNGFGFSASDPQAPPLLTISAPIGLQYGNRSGNVRSQGAILQVPNGQTLNLTGGNIAIEGGQLLAPGGRVELAGVAATGEVGLRQQGQEWRLNIPDGLARGDVSIDNDAIVNVRSGGGGSIAITARNFTGTGASTLVGAGIAAGLGTVEAQAGNIDINATEAINLDEMIIANQVVAGGTGNAGNINIITGTLSLTNGTQVSASTFGRGNAGNVTITASDAVSFDGEDSNGFSGGAFSSVQSGGIGQGGNVTITTGTLSFTNGAAVVTNTSGQGNAGNITITASDAMSFNGVDSNGFGSGAFSSVAFRGIGQGGNVTITTGTLSVANGAAVVAAAGGQGNAGNITIMARNAVSFDGVSSNGFSSGAGSQVRSRGIGQGGNVSITTGTLSVTNGAAVSASTFGRGDAGNVTITARDAVSFDGVGTNGSSSAASSQVVSGAIGQGGTIAINTERFSITNGAQLSTSSEGQGAAGDLEVTTRQLRLDTQGSIEAQTASGQGGNITLQVPDLLLLRRGSFISTTAGTDQAGGDGGNITLNSNLIVAVPEENSNITANAFTGRGGNIRITTQGLFGIEPRSSTTTGLSSITASSQFGISGTIVLNRPDVDPSQGLVQLPTELQDTSGLIAAVCPADEGNSFAITGRGGLPEDPRQPLMGESVWLDDRAPRQVRSTIPDPTPQIVEAQGWIRDRDGTIALVANHPSGIPQPSVSCR
ncbi:two-partner secretion domain-containing protein [Leptolyngbya sp. NIES-2104]|uniref:two-partner secretion domain-containing protein n=1 Tax=Leptolyngbya sp. NIES-2104 TaxID=1552121 RepID=UPI0006EC94A6|nr:filamentous hemagglutinin N-terminal domain-containing protein [Leptolyngbya sp. NIES-2104]GAP94808.1 putative hemagglutinin-related protein [Leptolyngbya sp. NIES-2104]